MDVPLTKCAIVLNRLREICPVKKIKSEDFHYGDEFYDEIEHDCMIAFKIIGYNPQNLDESVHDCWEQRVVPDNPVFLSDFAFDVWRIDQMNTLGDFPCQEVEL